MENNSDNTPISESNPTPTPPSSVYEAGISPEQKRSQRAVTIGIGIAILVFLLLTIAATVALLRQDAETTSKIADVFIIFMALESLLIGLVLVILIVQLARLINLLQHEIKPIVESTNETVSTLRGTTQFLSENLSEPVIRLNEYLAGMSALFGIFRPPRKKK